MLTPIQRRAHRLRCLAGIAIVLASGSLSRAESPRDTWIATAPLDSDWRQQVETLWQARPLRLNDFDRLFGLYARADVSLAELAAEIASDQSPSTPDGCDLSSLPPAVVADVALRVAAQHHFGRRYVESLAWLDASDPELCTAPQLYWHYRAVACHQLVRMEEAAVAAKAVLAIEDATERRTQEIAQQIHRDTQSHKPGDLSHIAHQMGDVRRRLWLGEGDQPNQDLQQQVIQALDKLIEKAEEQRRQQQQQQQSGQIAQGNSSRPMDDSRIADLKGAGEVDDRDIPPGGDWGSLPPAERERVTQQIIRDFPTHYRDVIEDYFRSLATEGSAEEDDR